MFTPDLYSPICFQTKCKISNFFTFISFFLYSGITYKFQFGNSNVINYAKIKCYFESLSVLDHFVELELKRLNSQCANFCTP